jgi:hypothetical protein
MSNYSTPRVCLLGLSKGRYWETTLLSDTKQTRHVQYNGHGSHKLEIQLSKHILELSEKERKKDGSWD